MGYTIFMIYVAAKNSVRPRKNTAEGGCGPLRRRFSEARGNSAALEQKIEASPAALLVQSRTPSKKVFFSF